MENSGGPSPLVPFLMLGVLGLIVYGPRFIVLLPLLLFVLVNLISTFCTSYGMCCSTRQQTSGCPQDAEGYGLGALLLLVLYLVGVGYASGHQTCSSCAQYAEGYGLKALLLLLLYLVCIGFTNQRQSSRLDAEGYGLGTLLLVALFYVLVLCNIR